MSCEEFQALLPDFAAGELPFELVNQFEKHLIQCDSCRLEFETELDYLAKLGNLPLVKCPDEVSSNILDQIEFEEERKKSKKQPWLWGTSSLVAAGLALILLLPGTNHPPGPTYTSAEIRTATREAQWALAKVATVINQNENNAFEQVFSQEISGAVGESLLRITKNLQGEV